MTKFDALLTVKATYYLCWFVSQLAGVFWFCFV